ncbi:pre-60S ribosomal particles component [Coemansia sp. RSA 2611]|nr:pre-60S ribosomal particles component [Coemansia sp. RSA 2705]KAJ2321142.1 pre-60S ribosomal particles component [Coemansia sp. RSA 2704]KAJ2387152.1 pre-60S ribosomal particles component [Coemansia sp. RSA 2611]KAJ2735772.1 pre-60S ribosomal particles component [Coemansia sp. Cherry 401B]
MSVPQAKTKTKVRAKGKVPAQTKASDSDVQSASEAESDYDELARTHRQELKAKRSKKPKLAEPAEFADALTSILAQDPRTPQAPIMAKNQVRAQQIKEEKLNYRARKALVEERRLLMSKDRVVPTLENFDHERRLRKTATRGVIKLFNVVRAQQTELDQINETQNLQAEKVAEMSKSKFLDLLKAKTS